MFDQVDEFGNVWTVSKLAQEIVNLSRPIIRREKKLVISSLKDTSTDNFMSEFDQTFKQKNNSYAICTIPEQGK